MNPIVYYQDVVDVFESYQNAEEAASMKAYMRGQFDYYGIRTPTRKEFQKAIFADPWRPNVEELKEIVQLCWDNPHRELNYFAMDLIARYLRKLDADFLPFLESLILQDSWWETVDWLAPTGVGKILLRHTDLIKPLTTRWIQDDNIWLQRSAILFQLKYKDKIDADLLKSHILYRADSKEFFVQKAAGWMLRQYSRYNPDWVKDFINENELSNLTKREGMKLF